MKVPSKGLEKKSSKIVKASGPDMGTYENKENADTKQSIRKRTPTVKFGKVVQARFTEEVATNKAFIPGVGNYKMEECYKKLSRPPSAGVRKR